GGAHRTSAAGGLRRLRTRHAAGTVGARCRGDRGRGLTMGWTVPSDAGLGDDNPHIEHGGAWRGDWRGLPVLGFNTTVRTLDQPGAAIQTHTVAVELPRPVPTLVLTPAAARGPIR